jgi:hypothetical protein
LRNPKDVEKQLRCNPLNSIVANLAAHTFQWQPPGIGIPGRNLCFGCTQLL